MIGFNEFQKRRALTAAKIAELNAWKHRDMDQGHTLNQRAGDPQIKFVGNMDELASAAAYGLWAVIGAGLYLAFRGVLWVLA
jgi:hypothetical protein